VMVAGAVIAVGGALEVTRLGEQGAGLLATPIIAGGVLLMFTARAMPQRTASGRDAMRRCLGFARYIKTAEVHQAAFAERAVVFTQYLPYAIVLKCVDKWARAFHDVDGQHTLSGFYMSSALFDTRGFLSRVADFLTLVSSAITSVVGDVGGSGSGSGARGGGGGRR